MAPSENRVRTPQQARSRRTRQAVLDGAARCFEANGYEGVTTAMIAAEAGIAVGTLYGYFRDKREILLELSDGAMQETSAYIISELESSQDAEDPRGVVRSIIDAVFHSDTLQPGVQRVMWERYFKDEDVQSRIDAVRGQTRAAVFAYLRRLDERGILRDIDAETAAYVITNGVQWNSILTTLEASDAERDKAAHATAEMVARFIFRD